MLRPVPRIPPGRARGPRAGRAPPRRPPPGLFLAVLASGPKLGWGGAPSRKRRGHFMSSPRTGSSFVCISAASLVLLTGGLLQAVGPEHSIARRWNERLLASIRKDLARPTVHARNLWYVSVAMWDSWAAYDPVARTFLHHEKAAAAPEDVHAAREETLSFACYRIIAARFASSPGAATTLPALDAEMDALGYDRGFTSIEGATPAAL